MIARIPLMDIEMLLVGFYEGFIGFYEGFMDTQ